MRIPTRLRIPLFLGGLALAVVAGFVALNLLVGDSPDTTTDELYAATTPTPAATQATEATPTATRAPGETPDEASATREPILLSPPVAMHIARLGVDADLVTLGIDTRTGNMAAPDGPELVGWYDFTATPGAGTGNAVFAGHRDWRGYGPAVFYDLGKLEAGDTVDVELQDGATIRYVVVAEHTYPVGEIDMREVLARTDEETLTLITCTGTFESGDYSDRHIVRAVRSEVIPAAGSTRGAG